MALLLEYNKSEALINHGKAVEGVMRYFARKRAADEDAWGIIGLIHDLDYERYPEQHCAKTREILEQHDWPEEYIRAAESHGWSIVNDVEPRTDLEKTLFAVDELVGLITACALVRPCRSVMDMKTKSVTKKWRQKQFAAGANREVIQKGADLLGIERNDLITDTIMGMREVADDIGL